jgi:hypothetical protein
MSTVRFSNSKSMFATVLGSFAPFGPVQESSGQGLEDALFVKGWHARCS